MSIMPPELRRFYKTLPMANSSNDSSFDLSDTAASPSTSDSSSPPSPALSPTSSPVPRIPRLNKNHGFLKCIIKNQIERDEYEKAIVQTRAERDERYQMNQVDQKIAQNRYIPPHMRKFVKPFSKETSPQPSYDGDDDTQNDPHYEMRARARRSLAREGIIQC